MVDLHKIKVIENWICNMEGGRIFKIWPTVLEIFLFKDLKPWLNFGGSIGPEGALWENTLSFQKVFNM